MLLVYIIDRSGKISLEAANAATWDNKAVCLYTPLELPPSPEKFSPKTEFMGDISFEIMYVAAEGNKRYNESDLKGITPMYVVPSNCANLLPLRLKLGSFEEIIETWKLTLDNDLKHTKEAAYQIAKGMEEKKIVIEEREQRRWERDYQERQEFMFSLPSAQRAREREDMRWSSYEYGRRMRSLARGNR